MSPPRGLLFDYGGTLVEERSVDLRAGAEWLFAQAADRPTGVTLADVLERAERVTREVADRRNEFHIETPWPTLTRLIHDYFGIRFDAPLEALELGYWKASVETRPMPGARDALERFHAEGLPMAVVSNSSFGAPVIRRELARHDLAEHLAFVLVSADYAVRKPNPLLFEVAAARLGLAPDEIWFVGDRLDTDVRGARDAGMTAVWFNRNGSSDAARGAGLTFETWEDLSHHVLRARSPLATPQEPR